jgi:phycoerythrin-associated linker protein
MQTFLNPVVNPTAKLGMSKFDETAPVELGSHASATEIEVVIRAAYNQVLGNVYVMESERLVVLESQLQQGNISVRQFVRQLAKSELYRSRFFDRCSGYRAIELNFKHLLGRAPESHAEMSIYSDIFHRGGFDAEIDAYIDSDEYQVAFGENTVPYYRGHKTQTGKSTVGFTHMFQLLRGAASSDKDLSANNSSRLSPAILNNRPSKIQALTGADNRQSRDANEILAELFKPKTELPTPITAPPVKVVSISRQEVIQKQQLIATLEQQLADLRPFAAIGASQIGNTWGVSKEPENTGDLVQQQIDQIAYLEAQIADARRYAAIGEFRLNKWQRRVFRG